MQTMPWVTTGEHPARWAKRTERVVDEAEWRARYDVDPGRIGPLLAALTPVPMTQLADLQQSADRHAAAAEEAEFAEFDQLYPPHRRVLPAAAEYEPPEFAEFDALWRR